MQIKKLKEDFLTIARRRPGLLASMIALAVLSLALLIFALLQLAPGDITTTVGYGDIGGYRAGSWVETFSFVGLALIWGVLHNLIAVRLYGERGVTSAKQFVRFSLVLVLAAFVVLLRLVGRG